MRTDLDSLLVVLDVVPVDIVVRTNRLLQFGGNNVTRALSGGTTGEGHNTASRVLEGSLKQTNGNAQGNTGAAQGTLVIGHRPGIALQLFEDIGDLELSLLNGHEEACSRAKGRTGGLLLGNTGAHTAGQAQHLLNLLGVVFLVASEHI